jgi:hypothetical protein
VGEVAGLRGSRANQAGCGRPCATRNQHGEQLRSKEAMMSKLTNDEIQQALDNLVANGWVEIVGTPQGPTRL